LSKAAAWAALAAIIAILLMVLGQWLLAVVVAALGGAGYVLARSIERILDEQELSDVGSRPRL
jgi:uncharacterized membrane protein